MPTLHTITGAGKWGDLILLADIGRIYSLDGVGRLQLEFGHPMTYDTSTSFANDDGKKNTCVDIAFQHLGLSIEPIKKFRQAADNPDTVSTPQELIDGLLSRFEKVSFKGTVGEFIQQHPTGNYYVSFFKDYSETGGHAFALLDGTAFNLKYDSPVREVDYVRRIA